MVATQPDEILIIVSGVVHWGLCPVETVTIGCNLIFDPLQTINSAIRFANGQLHANSQWKVMDAAYSLAEDAILTNTFDMWGHLVRAFPLTLRKVCTSAIWARLVKPTQQFQPLPFVPELIAENDDPDRSDTASSSATVASSTSSAKSGAAANAAASAASALPAGPRRLTLTSSTSSAATSSATSSRSKHR